MKNSAKFSTMHYRRVDAGQEGSSLHSFLVDT
jgi:hypothetical protein